MNRRPVLLECRNLQRPGKAGGPALLQSISLRLRAGERRGLVGKSGAGKSLLLRGLSRLDPQTTGVVEWRGQSVDAGQNIPRFRAGVLYVAQQATLLPGTVEENLRLPFTLASRQVEAFDRDQQIADLRAFSRDAAFLNQPVNELSGGEARIVALLRALQLQADVLLLDEPTSALDEENAQVAEHLVARWLATEPERAYLWVTHAPNQAHRVAEQVWELQAGQLREVP